MPSTRILLPAVFVLLLVSALVFGRQGFDEVVENVQPVRGAVHVSYGAGGNLGLSVGADGVLMIDTQFADLAAKIEAAIDTLSKEPVSFLVNTHWHGDHTGGNEHFGTQATILAHDNVRRRLVNDAALEGRKSDPPMAAAGRPVITYDEGLSVHFNGEEIRVMHLGRGHTDGDSVVWFTGSNVVHMGDLYFQNQYPFVDLDSGGDVHAMLAACQEVLRLTPDDVLLIPGHGEVTDKDGLREYVAMIEQVIERVTYAVGEGMTAEQMLDDGLLGDLDARWGQGSFMTPPRFLGIMAQNLAKE